MADMILLLIGSGLQIYGTAATLTKNKKHIWLVFAGLGFVILGSKS